MLKEIDGKKYQVLKWQKPEETDYMVGHCCFGIYAAKYSKAPYLVMANGDKTFTPIGAAAFFELKKKPQPLLVMDVPTFNQPCLVEAPKEYDLVSDIRDVL